MDGFGTDAGVEGLASTSAGAGYFGATGVVVVVARVEPSIDGSGGKCSEMVEGAAHWRATEISSALIKLGYIV